MEARNLIVSFLVKKTNKQKINVNLLHIEPKKVVQVTCLPVITCSQVL